MVGTITAQGFTACETAQITSITVETSGGNIDLYLVKGNATTLNGTSIYQSFTNQSAGVITLYLASPFNVNMGDLITFGIEGPAKVRLDQNPPMSPVGGANEILSFINGGIVTPQLSMDLYFKANLTPIPPIFIPTMNQWSLLIFSLLLLNLSLGIMLQKEQLEN